MSIGISIKVEPINGASPEEVFQSMIAVARNLGILVNTTLNGVPIVAGLIDTPEGLMVEWRRGMKRLEKKKKAMGLD